MSTRKSTIDDVAQAAGVARVTVSRVLNNEQNVRPETRQKVQRAVEALAGQLRAFLSNPKPFLERATVLQKYVGERFTVENMTNSIVDFYISELGAGVS